MLLLPDHGSLSNCSCSSNRHQLACPGGPAVGHVRPLIRFSTDGHPSPEIFIRKYVPVTGQDQYYVCLPLNGPFGPHGPIWRPKTDGSLLGSAKKMKKTTTGPTTRRKKAYWKSARTSASILSGPAKAVVCASPACRVATRTTPRTGAQARSPPVVSSSAAIARGVPGRRVRRPKVVVAVGASKLWARCRIPNPIVGMSGGKTPQTFHIFKSGSFMSCSLSKLQSFCCSKSKARLNCSWWRRRRRQLQFISIDSSLQELSIDVKIYERSRYLKVKKTITSLNAK